MAAAVHAIPEANADNSRLNSGVVANVYTVQHQAGCSNNIRIDPKLRLAAEWHTNDVLNNSNLDGDIGSDGSTPQTRAEAAGFRLGVPGGGLCRGRTGCCAPARYGGAR